MPWALSPHMEPSPGNPSRALGVILSTMNRRRLGSLSLAAMAVVGGCSSTHRAAESPSSVTAPRAGSAQSIEVPARVLTPPPDVVDGIPLRRLAELVRSPAAAWSEPHPFNIRVAVGSDRAANALMGRDGTAYSEGTTTRAYVVALDGHFLCDPPACTASMPLVPSAALTKSSTTTTAAGAVPISTMLLAFDPNTLQQVGSFRVVNHKVDMTRLGRVYSLDRYS